MAKQQKQQARWVGQFALVGTDRAALYAGQVESYDSSTRTAVLSGARQVVYWAAACHGATGIAAKGLQGACRVSPATELLEVPGVTSIQKCSDVARKSIEAEPWQ